MPIAQKEIELNDGSKIMVRQVSGRKKLKIETIQARVFRNFKGKGEPQDWDMDTHEEFADALDKAGAGIEDQVDAWLEECIISDNLDLDDLESDELMRVLSWVRGDDESAAIPLDSSQE